MGDYLMRYWQWRNNPQLAPALQAELLAISNEPEAIAERFSKDLSFGTAGLRGIMGAGTNRMNIYTVRKAAQGLANYLRKECSGKISVVIAYDTRSMSKEFALECALVLANNRIMTYLFREVAPTPLLSFAVGHLQTSAGIIITASHNPKEYNGIKIYWNHGGQIVDGPAEGITAEINRVTDELSIPVMPQKTAEDKDLLIWLNEQVYLYYLVRARQSVLRPNLIKEHGKMLKIVYTPLHGAGRVPVMELLTSAGFKKAYLVSEQADPDPDFSAVPYPNPEEPAVYELALQLARRHAAQLILCTDPDADRLGVMARTSEGDYKLLTGNQLGALLVDYILQSKQELGSLPANGIVLKTIVTSPFGSAVAAKYGIPTLDVLPGFKYIGEKVAQYEIDHSHTFLFGYEESCGFLAGDFVRDKDAVQAALLVCEMAAYYLSKNKSLWDRLQELYSEVGYYREELVNITFAGLEGQQKIARIMDSWRTVPPRLGQWEVAVSTDYQLCITQNWLEGTSRPTTLPCSNILHYVLTDEAWLCIRPLGTEPKLKVYLGVKGASPQEGEEKLASLKEAVMVRITSIA